MTEMLLQSHLGELHLLPAIPDEWKAGEVRGLKARGGYEVNLAWSSGKISGATIKSLNGESCTLRTATPIKIKGITATSKKTDHGYTTRFQTQKGKAYEIKSMK